MKTCLKALMLLAMAWAIPIANAAPSDYKLTVNTTPIWTVGSDKVPANSAYSVAVDRQNEKLYMFNYGVLHETNGDAKTLQTVTPPTGVTYNNTRGYGVAHDDAGNVIVVPNAASESRTITHLTMFKGTNIGSQNKVVNIPDLTAIVYHISATGDVYSGTGEVWHVAPSTNKIRKLSFSGGTPATSWTEYTLNITLSSMQVFVQKLSDGTLFLHDRSGHFYRVTLSGNTATCTEITLPSGITGSPKVNMGATMYIWKEHELLFCHSNSANYTSKFAVVDLTDNKVLATLDGIGAAGADGTGYSSWVHAVPDKDDTSGNTLDIYSYKLVNGAAKYSITATQTDTEAPVVVRTATVLNDNASFYRYAYVTDNVKVTDVRFPTWTYKTNDSGNAQDDLNWYTSKRESGSWTVDGQTYNWRVLVEKSEHNNETGPYITHVYAYDAIENSSGAYVCKDFVFDAPVKNLTSTINVVEGSDQTVTLKWEAPVGGGVTGYSVYAGETLLETITDLTYTTSLTAETTFKVVPTYKTSSVGDAATITVAPLSFMPPRDVRTTNYAGYCRVAVNYRAPENKMGYDVLYNIYRDDVLVGSEMAQFEFIDAGVAEGTHNYVVEAVYVVSGTKTSVAKVKSSPVSVTVDQRNEQKVNYRLETVYNHRVDELWNADASWETVAPGFNPINDIRANSENYRQGALVDIGGKKYWYIAVRSNTTTNSTSNGTAGGILKVSAEDDVIATGGAPTMLTLPKAISNGQTAGIATDDGGNIFVRALNPDYATSDYEKANNFNYTMNKGIIYSADLSKYYEFDLPGEAFAPEFDTSTDVHVALRKSTGRVDYYRMSGNLFVDGKAYLYCSATGSRLMTVVELTYNGSSVTATANPYQYKLETYNDPYSNDSDENGEVAVKLNTDHRYVVMNGTTVDYNPNNKVIEDGSSEHYVFPMFDKDETTLLGYIYERRSTGYFFIPKGATTQDQKVSIYTDGTDAGKVANSGGTLVRYQTKLDNGQIATQLFIITPQSFFSKNIGSFTVGAVYNNKFEKPAAANEEMIVPVANMVQSDFDNLNIVGNANGSWLFAEFNDNGTEDIAEDDHIDIYQYVPGVRIAKYKLYGSISFLSSTPVLTIETIKSTDEDGKVKEISHFTATTTWETPATYQGSGDYLIKEYLVELLDPAGNVIDTRTVDASTGIAIPNDPNGRMSYSLTFEKTDDLEGCTTTLPTGNSSNHFVDDNATYTSRVTVVYDLRQHIEDTTGLVPSDVKLSDVNSAQDTHEYTPNEPKGEVTVYTGKEGTNVDGAYRVEINILPNETESAPVSHYELSYWADKDEDGVKEQYKIEDFILVTSDGKTENQNIVPGTTVRYEQPGKVLSESGESFVCFYVDNREYVYDPVTDAGKWVLTEEEKDWQIPSNWEYQLTAVYANTNSLLRSAETATIKTTDIKNETTGEELLESSEEATLKAFPIPAGSTLTVQSPRGIEQITMISASGMVVKDIVGDGNTVMTINVDDLAAGYYMLRVNNMPPIKIVKK